MTDLISKREDGTEVNLLEALAESYSRDSLSVRTENYPLEYFKNLRSEYYTFSNVFTNVSDGSSVFIHLRSDDVDSLLSFVPSVTSEVRCRITLYEEPDVEQGTGSSRTARTLNRRDPDTIADGEADGDYVRVNPTVDDNGEMLHERMIGGDARGQARIGGQTQAVASFILSDDKDYLIRLQNTSNNPGNISFVGDVIAVNDDLIEDRLP